MQIALVEPDGFAEPAGESEIESEVLVVELHAIADEFAIAFAEPAAEHVFVVVAPAEWAAVLVVLGARVEHKPAVAEALHIPVAD